MSACLDDGKRDADVRMPLPGEAAVNGAGIVPKFATKRQRVKAYLSAMINECHQVVSAKLDPDNAFQRTEFHLKKFIRNAAIPAPVEVPVGASEDAARLLRDRHRAANSLVVYLDNVSTMHKRYVSLASLGRS